jgi:hypothetical protein
LHHAITTNTPQKNHPENTSSSITPQKQAKKEPQKLSVAQQIFRGKKKKEWCAREDSNF